MNSFEKLTDTTFHVCNNVRVDLLIMIKELRSHTGEHPSTKQMQVLHEIALQDENFHRHDGWFDDDGPVVFDFNTAFDTFKKK